MYDLIRSADGRPVEVERITSYPVDLPEGVTPLVSTQLVMLTIDNYGHFFELPAARQLVYDLASALTEDDDTASKVWKIVGGPEVSDPSPTL
ncbi:hypothetical protein [Nocardioides humi]|uniref:Uncharacterized protein n=1 Tax=Nocardioides humi TaxID=449461 RepID=A0ABN2BLX4_9ACTN|nr:hypothetical protein [Nocardioides humi]